MRCETCMSSSEESREGVIGKMRRQELVCCGQRRRPQAPDDAPVVSHEEVLFKRWKHSVFNISLIRVAFRHEASYGKSHLYAGACSSRDTSRGTLRVNYSWPKRNLCFQSGCVLSSLGKLTHIQAYTSLWHTCQVVGGHAVALSTV